MSLFLTSSQKLHHQDDQIQRPRSVNERPPSTNRSIGNFSASSHIDLTTHNIGNTTPSEHSTGDRTNSITSTSTRVLDDTNLESNSNEDNTSQRTAQPSVSRPTSVASQVHAKEETAENRPKTSSSTNSIGTTFSEAISVGESKTILHDDSLQETEHETDEKSVTPKSVRKLSTPDHLSFDDAISDAGSVFSVAVQPIDSASNSPAKQSEKSVNLITAELSDHQNDAENVPEPDAQSIITTNTESSSDYGANQPGIELGDENQSTDEVDHSQLEITVPLDVPLPISAKRVRKLLPRYRRVSPIKAAPIVHKTKQHKQLGDASQKFDKPKEALNACFHQLDSTVWEQTMNGLQTFIRLLRHHPDYVEPHIHTFSMALCKHIKNLRSQVSRTACLAAGEFFDIHGKLLEQEAEDLSVSLLNRTADTNKFLRSDATKALETMCDNLPISKVIQIMTSRGTTHQNAIVRTASARLCNRIVERIGCDKVFTLNRDIRDKIILTGANMMMEGSLEARNYAKSLFRQLSAHPSYTKTILDVIPPRTYRNIEKTLRSIK